MSGTPRWLAGIGVLPAGSVVWKSGLAKTWLKPPPVPLLPGVSHTTSACPGAFWHAVGGSALSTTRADVLLGSVHSAVPPTPVTSGSEAGHPTVCPGIVEPPLPTGDLRALALPLSPDDARTVTSLAAA